MTDIRIIKTNQALETAMSNLLAEKSFDRITTTELVKRAGISRSNFYTHYQDKYEMIDQYQHVFFKQLEYIFDKHFEDLHAAVYEIFEMLYHEKLLSALLSENGTREIHIYMRQKLKVILTTFFEPNFSRKDLKKIDIDYRATYFSHAIFGTVQLWLKRGKKENPREITDTIITMAGF
ncbi:TetR/AcrR family transcriptional regulator [Lactococcus insecticola]|uniref:Putative transcriptional regulator (TetR/AcrR family) n=1 Tax=Pseudolactococcus insecticola TaxID=2709158 RepID=A0A6A0B4X8_9LACT|nr:TetR/AcrR family transcriptional regulator C-terminal domain-containing protein [Lactococcus insecticola]GFH39755.1 putative transcriptional regulator (TetR/AcrR family) [Lactococcus insecticola]